LVSSTALLALIGVLATATPAAGHATTSAGLPTLAAPVFDGANVRTAAVSGTIRSPGGPYLFDREGRVVFFHGVDAVYKYAPYELYPDAGKPWNFSVADASLMARLGFNVVRLGMTWSGLEPGQAPANDPAICDRGKERNPHQFSPSVLDRYIGHLRTTVNLLARFHIYTILDMHQDVYNQMFEGEGAPNWAVCTDNVPSVDPPGRWSLAYGTSAADIAFSHFWKNNVQGDLQGQYDKVWGDVAQAFRHDPWVLGFDPFNEPFSTALVHFHGQHFDGQLECFYTGRAHVGTTLHGAPPLRCPRSDPRQGVVPTILANDPTGLIFDEPDNYASRGFPTYLGPMDLKNLVFNVHIYCGARSPVTGNPTDLAACEAQDLHSIARRQSDRPLLSSPAQRGGPAWMVTEFGATKDVPFLAHVTAQFDADKVGWIYWAWKYYDDPTGSAAESLVMADGHLRSTASVLSQTYPEAVAGLPLSFGYSPLTNVFDLSYVANHRIHAPTVVFVPTSVHYRRGYCAHAAGGRIVSGRGSDLLEVDNRASAHQVTVTVTAGRCAPIPTE
jgi:endoglycosylceramidase